MLNIPIYRAKRIDSDEYVEGYYKVSSFDGQTPIIQNKKTLIESIIDAATLSISFEDMLDSEGTKIFASLSESGRGGDILEKIGEISKYNQQGYFDLEEGKINQTIGWSDISSYMFNNHYGDEVPYKHIKVTGIQND